jgi:replicative DNA helicase
MGTGFGDLDALIGGFYPGDLVVVGGGSGTGKSAFTQNVALQVARQGGTAAIFSFEATQRRVMQRLISSLTGVPLATIVRNELTEQHWRPLLLAHRNPLWTRLCVVGSANLRVGEVRHRVQRMSAERGRGGGSPLSLVVADCLQLMVPAPVTREERHLLLATTLVQLKRMARDLRVPVLLVGQLDRGARDLRRRPPVVSDLEGSEVVESYADTVLLLRREEDRDTAEIIVAKQPEKRVGKVALDWYGECVRFESRRSRPATADR